MRVRVEGRVRGQWLGVVAAAVVASAGALAPAQSEAAIVYSGITNINIPSTTAGVYLNLVTGVSATAPAGAPGWDFNAWGAGNLFAWANVGGAPTAGVVCGLGSSAVQTDSLALGTVVGAAQTFCAQGNPESAGSTAYVLNAINYVGIRFLNEGTGLLNYGWIAMQVGSPANAQPRSIVGWAYENTGASIAVGSTGAVPEPATLGLLAVALGAAGLAGRRGGKRAAAA